MIVRLFLLFTAMLSASAAAEASRLVRLDIVDRPSNTTLTQYRYHGQAYVAGQPGKLFGIRMTNLTDRRIMVVLSADGVNVVSGETASPGQSGYVLAAHASTTITGWRKDMDSVAQFYFSSLDRSYAARTGRPDNVGVIGAAAFIEREPEYAPAPLAEQAAKSRSAGNMADAAKEANAVASAPALGTGHGGREWSPTRYTAFERLNDTPDEIVTVRYDSRANLVAQGVIPRPRWYGYTPNAFPGQFVPDPAD